MHPKDWLEYQLKIRAAKRYQCIRITSYRSYFLERKWSMQFFAYQQFSKTDSLNLQVGRTELIQSILVVRQLYLADHLGLSDAVAFYIITYIIYIYAFILSNILEHIISKKDVQAMHVESRPGTWRCFIFDPERVQSVQTVSFVRRRWRRTSPTLLQHTLKGSHLRSMQTSNTASYVSLRCIKRITWSHEVHTSHRFYFCLVVIGYVCAFSDVGVAFVYDL